MAAREHSLTACLLAGLLDLLFESVCVRSKHLWHLPARGAGFWRSFAAKLSAAPAAQSSDAHA